LVEILGAGSCSADSYPPDPQMLGQPRQYRPIDTIRVPVKAVFAQVLKPQKQINGRIPEVTLIFACHVRCNVKDSQTRKSI